MSSSQASRGSVRSTSAIVRPSWIFCGLFTIVGTLMIVERLVTGDGQLVAGIIIMAAGLTYVVNKVEVHADSLRIRTPLRDVVVHAPKFVADKRQHVVDGTSGEAHRLPIGIWAEDVKQMQP